MKDMKIKVGNEEVIRLSEFIKSKCDSEEMAKFNMDRIIDSLSDVSAWKKFHIPVKVGEQEVEYFEIEKVEE